MYRQNNNPVFFTILLVLLLALSAACGSSGSEQPKLPEQPTQVAQPTSVSKEDILADPDLLDQVLQSQVDSGQIVLADQAKADLEAARSDAVRQFMADVLSNMPQDPNDPEWKQFGRGDGEHRLRNNNYGHDSEGNLVYTGDPAQAPRQIATLILRTEDFTGDFQGRFKGSQQRAGQLENQVKGLQGDNKALTTERDTALERVTELNRTVGQRDDQIDLLNTETRTLNTTLTETQGDLDEAEGVIKQQTLVIANKDLQLKLITADAYSGFRVSELLRRFARIHTQLNELTIETSRLFDEGEVGAYVELARNEAGAARELKGSDFLTAVPAWVWQPLEVRGNVREIREKAKARESEVLHALDDVRDRWKELYKLIRQTRKLAENVVKKYDVREMNGQVQAWLVELERLPQLKDPLQEFKPANFEKGDPRPMFRASVEFEDHLPAIMKSASPYLDKTNSAE